MLIELIIIIIIIIIIKWRNFGIHLEMSPTWIHSSWNTIIMRCKAAYWQNRIMYEKRSGFFEKVYVKML
jgi:hypothetical protein